MHDKPRTERYLPLSGIHDFVRSVQLVARRNHIQNVISSFRAFTISCVACNLLHEETTYRTLLTPFGFTISYVACILMHGQITHGTLFHPFGYSRFRAWRATYCTKKPHTERYLPLSGIHDFVRSVQLVARRNHIQNVISSFRALTISCVACILMHDQITHGTLFHPFGHSQFRK